MYRNIYIYIYICIVYSVGNRVYHPPPSRHGGPYSPFSTLFKRITLFVESCFALLCWFGGVWRLEFRLWDGVGAGVGVICLRFLHNGVKNGQCTAESLS